MTADTELDWIQPSRTFQQCERDHYSQGPEKQHQSENRGAYFVGEKLCL